jgi:hypothetical protein
MRTDSKHGAAEKSARPPVTGAGKSCKGYKQIKSAAAGSKGSRSSTMTKAGAGASKTSSHGNN